MYRLDESICKIKVTPRKGTLETRMKYNLQQKSDVPQIWAGTGGRVTFKP